MKFVRPINTGGNPANISTPFGSYHPGIDYAYPEGTKIYASEEGDVTIAKGNEKQRWIANGTNDPFRIAGQTRALRNEDYGNFIKIQHLNNYGTLYAHLKYDSLYVKVGDHVKKGQLIAQVGTTGNSTGNHLHWETRLSERAFDPNTMFDAGFTKYEDRTPAAQVAVDAEVFPKLVFASDQYDKIVAEYKPGSDPKSTPFDEIKNIINGKISRVTGLENEKAELKIELAKVQAENNNRIEQIGRTKRQLLESNLREESLLSQLKQANENAGKGEGVYKKQLESKQKELEAMSKAKGIIQIEAAEWKTKYELAIKNIKTKSLYDVCISLVFSLSTLLKKYKV